MSNTQLVANTNVVPIREPNYLRENWKALLGASARDELKFVRVIGGVANVTNGSVLLRSPVGQVPDGFYVISPSNDLVPAPTGSSPRWLAYPDVETCRPRFDKMQPSPVIAQTIVRELLDFAEVVRRATSRYESRIVMDRGGFFAAGELSFNMPFPILNSGEEILLDPLQLRLLLTDMLRYENGIVIAKEAGPDTPVVFGLDWGHCGLIRPLADRWKNELGYH